MSIVACDPGLDGAFALNDWDVGRLDIYPMPTQSRQISGKKTLRRIIDEGEVVALMRYFADMGATVLYIEQVGGLPRQSAPAAFSFGQGYGTVRAAAVAAGLAIEAIPAATWKAAMRLSSDKKAVRQRAGEMIPTHRHFWPLAKDDGKAEAALLSLYGQRMMTGGVQRSKKERDDIEKAQQARADSAAHKLVRANVTRARYGRPLREKPGSGHTKLRCI